MNKTMIVTIVIILSIVQFSFAGTNIQLSKKWEIDGLFMTPESVVYDSVRGCLYVSHFNDKGGFRNEADTTFDECVSKVNLDGHVVDLRWIDHLLGPTGITIFDDRLYVVERGCLCIINIEKEAIEKRIPIENSKFLNDIAIDHSGCVYISDTEDGSVFKFENNGCEVWIRDTLTTGANGLYIDNNRLIVGCQSSHNLVSISIPGKEMEALIPNILVGIDGIKKFKDHYIVSWMNKIVLVDHTDSYSILLEASDNKGFFTDFELREKEKLLIVPTFSSNKLVAYEIIEEE